MPLAARRHGRGQRPGQGDRRPQIDLQHPIDLILVKLVEQTAGRVSGVGHQDVHAADLPDQVGHILTPG